MKVLSYNISWECMLNSSDGSAGKLGALCVDDICLKNVADYINFINRKVNFLDVIALQEASNSKKLLSKIQNLREEYYIVKSMSGNEEMITCYRKKYKLINKHFGDFGVGGRPFQILNFKDFIFVNLHFCHPYKMCRLRDRLSRGAEKMELENKEIILAGDFNYTGKVTYNKKENFIKFRPFNQISTTVYADYPEKTCCNTSSKNGKKMYRIGDFIMSSKGAKNRIYYKNKIKGLTSDHYPILIK